MTLMAIPSQNGDSLQREGFGANNYRLANGSNTPSFRSQDLGERLDEPTTITSTPTLPRWPQQVPSFDANASLALVGIRGAGKSTLAIMASSAMKRKVVDTESSFQRATGMSSAVYRKTNGAEDYYRKQAEVLRSILELNKESAIIVCSWMERSAQALLREFAAHNPVIHVVRDLDAVQKHLRILDRSRVQSLVDISHNIFRSCSNFEFFNVSELPSIPPQAAAAASASTSAPYLTLKQAERHLLKFLCLVYPRGSIPFIESAFPLATIAPDEREFTYALNVHLSHILDGSVQIEEQSKGVDAIQIQIDDLTRRNGGDEHEEFIRIAASITKALGQMRRSTMLPILVHIALPDGNISEATSILYFELVAHALSLAPEMVTIDLRLDETFIGRLIQGKRRSKVMAVRHLEPDAPAWSSPIWLSWYRKAVTTCCDLVRFTRAAASIEDNFEVSRMRASVANLDGPRIPLVAFNTGQQGRNSAYLNPILTVVRTDTLTHAETDISNTCSTQASLTAFEATRALYSSFIYDEMKLYVFGFSVGYSMSPAMHNAGLQACGIPHRYVPQSTDSLSSITHLIEDPYFGGASIGLPFKVEIIALTHSMSRHAQAIGAVNTLIPVRCLSEDGSVPTGADFFRGVNRAGPVKALYGENTDWIGIRACIKRGLSPANAVRPTTCGVVVGAGGMARAAVYAMLQVGVKDIVLYNRTTSNAEKLAAYFTKLLQNSSFELLSSGGETRFHVMRSLNESWPLGFRLPTIIISSIPTHRIGDIPAPDFTVPEAWFGNRTGGVVIELGYKTLNTPLLVQARKAASRGWVSMDGLDLLPEQGFAQFELFTGRRAPRREMTRQLFRSYRDDEGRANLRELEQRLQLFPDQDA